MFQNVYCGKCRHCIGFRIEPEATTDVFCLKCEKVVREELERRQGLVDTYRRAVTCEQKATKLEPGMDAKIEDCGQ